MRRTIHVHNLAVEASEYPVGSTQWRRSRAYGNRLLQCMSSGNGSRVGSRRGPGFE
jgi:hypothetical protein